MNILFYCKGDDGGILQSLRDRLPEHQLIDWANKPDNFDPAAVTAAITWKPPAEFFDGLSSLEHVHAFSAGVDHLLQHPGLPEHVCIVRLLDAGMAEQMAEYALYGILHSQRCMAALRQAQDRAEWQQKVAARPRSDMHVGVLGAGALGLHVASSLSMIGYPVSCWSRTARSSPDGRIRMLHASESLPEFLSRCRVLVCLLPLTDATTGILDADLFARLPRGAFLINPGRGAHLVEQDLLQALESGQLGGALLDVFDTEPLPADHAFWHHPDILITPHVAAQSLEQESIDQIVANVRRIEAGERPSGIVDRELGY